MSPAHLSHSHAAIPSTAVSSLATSLPPPRAALYLSAPTPPRGEVPRLAGFIRAPAAPHSAHVCATVCGAHSIDDGDGDGEGDGEGAANVMRACDGEAKGEDDENEVEGEGEREGEGEGEGEG